MTGLSQTQLPNGYRALVVGATGGLGAAFCQHLSTDPRAGAVFAASRSGADMAGAKGLVLDLDRPETIATCLDAAHAELGLHMVIVATGILHDENGLQPERSWRALEASALMEVFRINTILPALVARESLTVLADTSRKEKSRVIFSALSARVGSISDNQLGGWHSYRASKAALNQLIKTFSIELQRKAPLACCVGLHPGTVDTALSKPFQRGVPDGKLFDAAFSAGQLLSVLDQVDPSQSGQVFDWAGKPIPA